MKEIGGYLEFEQLISNEYYKNLIALNTARNALVYILKARKIKKLYIPYYLCDSVSDVCNRENYKYEFYFINEDFSPKFNKKLAENEYLYIVNYYGQITNDKIVQYKQKYQNIIVDNVQAFFQKPVDGVDTIYSCRKFFGVPDGAYLSTDCFINEKLKTDVSSNRMKHLLGRFECGTASEYYKDFKNNDESFSDLELMYMSKLTHNLLGAIDYEYARKKREENFAFIHNELGKKNRLNLKIPIGPYAYPFYCENGIGIRKKLAQSKIYVPTLWPAVFNICDENEKEYDLAKNVLPIPIDQRYNTDDMVYLIREIQSRL